LIPSTGARIHNDLVVSQLYFNGNGSQALPAPFKSETDKGDLLQKASASASPIGRIGVGSMAIKPDNFTSTHTITITRREKNSEGVEIDAPVENEFEFTPVLKDVPAGLWGDSLTPKLNGTAFVKQALSGFEIRPKEQPKPGETKAIDRTKLQFEEPEKISNAYGWEKIAAFRPGPAGAKIGDTITKDSTASARTQLLTALGVSAEIDLSDTVAASFLVAPQIEAN
jgi:hypothetical protein